MLRPAARLSPVLAMLAAVGLPALLWASGVHLPGTQPSDGEGDPAFPPFLDGTNPGRFDDPGTCDNCHADYRDAGQAIHEPFNSWAGSLMANAARDPLFWAAVDIANQDDAVLGDVDVGDLCIRCHVPVGWYEGRSDCPTPWGEEFDGSCLAGSPSQGNDDFEGITCHFCHRAHDAGNPPAGQFQDPGAPYMENAQVYLTTEPNTMYGPYVDADPRRHQFRASEFLRSSAYCGQCHDVTNPARNRRDPVTGADLGTPMPVERTWSEYSQSAFADPADPAAATCHDCHMPPPDFDGDGSPDPAYAAQQQPFLRGDDPAEGDFHPHWFAGGGSWMIELLRNEHGAALGRDAEFAAARDESLALLQDRTVGLELQGPATVEAGTELAFEVTVENRAGHKFPTGYPEGRRAWVRVEAGQDADGDGELDAAERLFSSGGWDPATGVLADDPQLKVYELEIGVFDWNGTGECDLVDGTGRKMFHFVLNDCIAKDDRIPPLGFVPNADTAPVAYAYPENPARPGTLLNADVTSYAVPVPAGISGQLLVIASVQYQTTSSEYVEFLRDENLSECDPFDAGCDPTLGDARPNRGEKMHALWEAHGRSAPVELARVSAAVSVTAAPVLSACCLGPDCFSLTEADCLDGGGTWQGEGVDCADVACAPPPVGACCLGPDCFSLTEADCLDGGGTWQGEGVDCADVACAPPPVGACCLGPDCFSLTEADCLDGGGTWQGEGVDCADVACAPPPVVPGEARNLRVRLVASGELALAWEAACDADDHAWVLAPLAGLSPGSWTQADCGLGVTGAATRPAPSGSLAFVIVGLGPEAEGSYGRDAFGVERPERDAGDACDRPRDLNPTCE